MKSWIFERLYIFYSMVLLLYLINVFADVRALEYAVGLLAIPMMGISFIWASNLFRVLGGAFIGTGAIMFLAAGLPFREIPLFFTSNLALLAYLVILPWINSIVHVGKYDTQMKELMKGNVNHLGNLYIRSSITTYILMMFLNISAVTLTQEMLIKNMKKMKTKVRNAFISQTTVRAFAIALIWSPMEVMVALTVEATGVSYLFYLPWLMLISLLVLSGDLLIGWWKFRSVPYIPVEQDEAQVPVKSVVIGIAKLLFALCLFLSTILFINQTFDLNFILTVTLVILPFSAIWAMLIKRWTMFKKFGFEVWKNRTNHQQNFIILFISLSFFSNSLNETDMLNIVQEPFHIFADYPVIILYLILVTYFVMAMIGIHPVGTIAILLEVLTPLFGFINPAAIGIVMIVAALATSASATYGVTVTITAMNTVQNPYKITLQNLLFTFVFGSVGIGMAMFFV
ncbi:hypothetical protein [Oceanobacillus salinisoli]|uniref:hypothetical protein n=1 Tax=Oceanobacillus salinisoli TaxID=2678611 RepID=UPI0012E2EF60|nr:hypothetical protein [Oceanobacillus salinisoli]